MITKKIFVVMGEYDYGHSSIYRAFSTRNKADEWVKSRQTPEERADPYGYHYYVFSVDFDDYTKVKKNV